MCSQHAPLIPAPCLMWLIHTHLLWGWPKNYASSTFHWPLICWTTLLKSNLRGKTNYRVGLCRVRTAPMSNLSPTLHCETLSEPFMFRRESHLTQVPAMSGNFRHRQRIELYASVSPLLGRINDTFSDTSSPPHFASLNTSTSSLHGSLSCV